MNDISELTLVLAELNDLKLQLNGTIRTVKLLRRRQGQKVAAKAKALRPREGDGQLRDSLIELFTINSGNVSETARDFDTSRVQVRRWDRFEIDIRFVSI